MAYCDENCRAEKWHQDVNGSRYHYCAVHGLIQACDLDEQGHDIGVNGEHKGR